MSGKRDYRPKLAQSAPGFKKVHIGGGAMRCGESPPAQHCSDCCTADHHRPRRNLPDLQQQQRGQRQGEVAWGVNGGRPDRVVERGQQQADDGGVDAHQGAAHGGVVAQAVPQRQGPGHEQKAGQEDAQQRHARAQPATRPLRRSGAQKRGKGEQRPRHGLCRAVACEEGGVVHACRDDLGPQQRQHHMAAAKHQRARLIETGKQRERGLMQGGREQRQADQQRAERCEQHHGAAMTQRHVQRRMHRFYRGAQQPAPDHRAEKNDGELTTDAGHQRGQHRGGHSQAGTFPIRAEAAAHAPQRLRHHRDGHQLEPMQPAAMRQRADMREQQGEGGHRQRRRQGEAQPGGQRAVQTPAHQSQPDADLRTRRAGQELAQRHQIAIRLRRQPAAPLDELAAEIFQMRNRPAERGESQTQKGKEDRRRCLRRRHARVLIVGHGECPCCDVAAVRLI